MMQENFEMFGPGFEKLAAALAELNIALNNLEMLRQISGDKIEHFFIKMQTAQTNLKEALRMKDALKGELNGKPNYCR